MKLSGQWEMFWKNPDYFETVQKFGNDLEKTDNLSVLSVLRSKISGRTKKIPGTLLTRFLHLWGGVREDMYLYIAFHCRFPDEIDRDVLGPRRPLRLDHKVSSLHSLGVVGTLSDSIQCLNFAKK